MDRSQLAARIQEILKTRPKPAAPGPAAPPAGEPSTSEAGHQGTMPVAADADAAPGPHLSTVDEEAAFARRCAQDEAGAGVLERLGGRLIETPGGGTCLVVERQYDGRHSHGRCPLSHYASALGTAASGLDVLLGREPDSGLAPGVPRALFFDLETTGLSGGAGTYAFLVGCGYFDADGFQTRQFFLRGYGEERAMLRSVTAYIQGLGTHGRPPAAGCQPPSVEGLPASCQARGVEEGLPASSGLPAVLVTYNGKAFDLPLIETRYLMHRLASPLGGLPHIDLLFPARRLWRRRLAREGSNRRMLLSGLAAGIGDDHASCALTVLEEDILGLRREDDVPGWEIPARFFAYARTGDARGLEAVLEHNRLDLVSLGVLTAVVLEMVAGQEPRDRYEALALGRLFESLGRSEDAERCYLRAAEPDGLFEAAIDGVARAEALHWLALHRRRGRRFGEAAETWRQILEITGVPADLRREALEALAIHHEHRAKDLAAARRFALGALGVAKSGRSRDDLQHRLGRLSRKIGGQAVHLDVPFPHQPSLPAED